MCIYVYMTERARKRERENETERATDTERETDIHIHTERESHIEMSEEVQFEGGGSTLRPSESSSCTNNREGLPTAALRVPVCVCV